MMTVKEYFIDDNTQGIRLDNFITEIFPLISVNYIQKIIRKQKIRVNGKQETPGYSLKTGDFLQIFLPENFEANIKHIPLGFKIVYEDSNIILADKKAGILCEDSDKSNKKTLIYQMNQYLKNQGNKQEAFLCNRIDCNTAGIVIAAKNKKSKDLLDEKIRQHEILKTYLCIVLGTLQPSLGHVENYLFKDSKRNTVYISERRTKGSKNAVADYRTLATSNNLSLVECQLCTGRTHQIRSQLAYAGFPLLGDDKYGNRNANNLYKEKKQLLCSYKIKFNFKSENHHLAYLNHQVFQIENVGFCRRYFSNVNPL